MTDHLPRLQRQFHKEWGKRDPYCYGQKKNPKLVLNIIRASYEYEHLIKEGKTENEALDVLGKVKRPMTVFTWNGPVDTLMSFIDSIKYYKNILQTGLCAVDPHNGKIRAWIGGINFNFFKYDHTKQSTKRQVGSTIKPLLYNVALENGLTPCSKLLYEQPNISGFEEWDPKGSRFFKEGDFVSLKDGLQVSDNRVAALIIKQYSPSLLIDKAEQLGIDAEFENVPAISLGTTDISVIEMVGAYTPYMNRGIYSKPYYIDRIEDKNGNTIFQNIPRSKEAINEEIALLMNLMLQGVSKGKGTSSRLRSRYGLQGEIACKTGTTQSNSDGWFIGSTPSLLTGVWVGADDPSITFASTRLGQGSSSALPIWAKLYKSLNSDKSLKKYHKKSFFRSSDSTLIDIFECKYSPQENIENNNSYHGNDVDIIDSAVMYLEKEERY